MSSCPLCFQAISPTKFAWVCMSASCERAEDRVASTFAGYSVESGPVRVERKPADAARNWVPRDSGHCPNCSEQSSEACPNCHYPLPSGWRTFDVTTIAMSGARATGKSVYIAVAIRQLGLLLSLHRSTIEPATSQTRDTYVQYYEKPLFETLGLMPPTPRASSDTSVSRHPMIFTLGVVKGLRRFLVFRDVAGEEMESATESSSNLSFLKHADAVFFMFDPLGVPQVRNKLQELVPRQLQVGGDPKAVLANLQRLVEGGSPRLAIILSKFDALQALRDVDDVNWRPVMSNPGAAFLRDPSLETAHYDKDDGELLSLEVESLLHKLDAESFVLSLRSAQGFRTLPHRFFAIAGLGESPDGDMLHERGISPFRVLDPIKWILDAKGII